MTKPKTELHAVEQQAAGDCAERQETPETSVNCTLVRHEGGKKTLAKGKIAMPFSLDIVGPDPGEYGASVVEIRVFERPNRLLALITFVLDSDPPFSVPDFVSLRAEREGTDVIRGRTRIRQLFQTIGRNPDSISSPDDLQCLVGARVRVAVRVRERDGIQVPEIASILPPTQEP